MLGNGRTQGSVCLEHIHSRHGQKNLLGEGNALSSASSMQIRSMLLVSTIPEVTVVIT
jgi:hypothetical protein